MASERVVYSPAPHPESLRAIRARGNAALWFGVLGGPAAWSFDTLAALALQQSWCSATLSDTLVPFRGVGLWLVLLGIVTGGVAIAAGVTAWRLHGELGNDTGKSETDLDRRRFMAHAGMYMAALFLFAIVLRWAATFIVDPTICRTLS